MFTGIVERTARLADVRDSENLRRLTIESSWDDAKPGESVAVNGVCLTVAGVAPGTLGFDVIAETLDKSNLGLLEVGDGVHVERAMKIGDRIDGHFVQGHVDGTGKLLAQTVNGDEFRLMVEIPTHLRKFFVPKGSVSMDGVSLTIAALTDRTFDVALIPTTLSVTMLGRRPVGWPFNLEADVLSKTIVNWLELRQSAP